jgi:hypothetical protein
LLRRNMMRGAQNETGGMAIPGRAACRGAQPELRVAFAVLV